MPAKAPPIKLLQLKLPGYSARIVPGRLESWLADVVTLNKKKDRSLLTEVNIKRAWTDTMRNLQLDNRVEEMNSKAGKSAMLGHISLLQTAEQTRTSEVKNSRGKWHIPSVHNDLDISEYKIPTLDSKRRMEHVRYSHFAKQVQQANVGKPFSQEVVDACFWSMMNEILSKAGRGSSSAPKILKDAKGVLTQADTYWTNLKSSESVPE